MLDRIKAAGELENTLVIVTSDNGMPFPRAKANLYEQGLRIPLVAAWPAQLPGGIVCEKLVSLIDLAPTILEATGLTIPDTITGKSLIPHHRKLGPASGLQHYSPCFCALSRFTPLNRRYRIEQLLPLVQHDSREK